MLNYIWAELYKIRRRKAFWVFLSFLLVLELLYLSPMGGITCSLFLKTFSITHPVGLFLVLPFSSVVCSGLGKAGGVKNELAFGLTRPRIYVGKLLSSLILAFLVLSAVVLIYLGAGWLWVGENGVRLSAAELMSSLHYLFLSLPLWIGALSLVHMLYFLSLGSGVAVVIYSGYLMVGEWTLLVLFGVPNPAFSVWWGERVVSLLLTYPFVITLGEELSESWMLLHSWLVGLVWLTATTALGLKNFHGRELR